MDDLVERLPKEAAMLREIAQSYSRGVEWRANLSASATVIEQAAARITTLTAERDALKRQLEAKAKLTITDVRVGPPIYNPSTALETGEWKK